MLLNTRLDGHIVQGHVDQIAICTHIADQNGSTRFTFSHSTNNGNITIEKGSITINGVSLTVIDSLENQFSVAIIPYTMQHTTFKHIRVGGIVNLEFDVIGKYVAKLLSMKQLPQANNPSQVNQQHAEYTHNQNELKQIMQQDIMATEATAPQEKQEKAEHYRRKNKIVRHISHIKAVYQEVDR